MRKKVINKLRSIKNGFYTSWRKLRKGSDYQRWESERNLSPSWDSRTQQIAKLIDAHASVIEFGAGRLILKAYLPDGCTYTPSDLVDRGNGTIICDLNSDELPQLQSYDIAVFSGVLEYVNNVPKLISHLSNCVDVIIASYAVTDSWQHREMEGKEKRHEHLAHENTTWKPASAMPILEVLSSKSSRRASGWVNDFSSKEFIKLFSDAGFQCDHTEKWGSQVIYRFRKGPDI